MSKLSIVSCLIVLLGLALSSAVVHADEPLATASVPVKITIEEWAHVAINDGQGAASLTGAVSTWSSGNVLGFAASPNAGALKADGHDGSHSRIGSDGDGATNDANIQVGGNCAMLVSATVTDNVVTCAGKPSLKAFAALGWAPPAGQAGQGVYVAHADGTLVPFNPALSGGGDTVMALWIDVQRSPTDAPGDYTGTVVVTISQP